MIQYLLTNLKIILLPFLPWKEKLRDPKNVRADIVAGFTVALVLIPQSMAYAQLAGLPPYYGLYASFLPVIVASLFGSSYQLATGPVAVVSLLTASALAPYAMYPETYVAYAILLAVMVGSFQLLLGNLKLGVLVDFLSHPVVIGFTNAAAIIIASSQIGKLFGVVGEKAEHQYETLWNTLVAASQDTHLETLGIALLALIIMILLKKYAPRIPAIATAVVVTTVISWLSGFEQGGGRVVGAIPAGLPSFTIPTYNMEIIIELMGVTIAIALIGFMEAISVAKAMAAHTRQRLDPNQELVGQGLANIISGFFSGYAVSGSFSRSAINIDAGAVTGLASVITGIIVGLTLLFITPLLYHLPQATLAAVIIMAVSKLIKIKPVIQAWKAEPHDGIVAIVVFCLTLFMAPHLENGIIAGILLSLILFNYRTMRPRFVELSRFSDGNFRDAKINKLDTCCYISILRFDMSLYFANAGYFETKVLENLASKPQLKYIIIDAAGINMLDATGQEMLCQLKSRLHKVGVELLFARIKGPFMNVLRRTGALDCHGHKHVFPRVQDAINYASQELSEDFLLKSPLVVTVIKG